MVVEHEFFFTGGLAKQDAPFFLESPLATHDAKSPTFYFFVTLLQSLPTSPTDGVLTPNFVVKNDLSAAPANGVVCQGVATADEIAIHPLVQVTFWDAGVFGWSVGGWQVSRARG